MKTLKIILIVIVALIALMFIAYTYFGGLKKITFRIIDYPQEVFVYKPMLGDYSKSKVVMDEVYYTLLNDFKIETYKGCGNYLDNPKDVEKSKLRSEIGCILEPKDTARIAEIQEKIAVKIIPAGKYAVAEFPNKGGMSVFVGIMKAYPALNKFIEENGMKKEADCFEIYDIPNKKIIYRINAEK